MDLTTVHAQLAPHPSGQNARMQARAHGKALAGRSSIGRFVLSLCKWKAKFTAAYPKLFCFQVMAYGAERTELVQVLFLYDHKPTCCETPHGISSHTFK